MGWVVVLPMLRLSWAVTIWPGEQFAKFRLLSVFRKGVGLLMYVHSRHFLEHQKLATHFLFHFWFSKFQCVRQLQNFEARDFKLWIWAPYLFILSSLKKNLIQQSKVGFRGRFNLVNRAMSWFEFCFLLTRVCGKYSRLSPGWHLPQAWVPPFIQSLIILEAGSWNGTFLNKKGNNSF